MSEAPVGRSADVRDDPTLAEFAERMGPAYPAHFAPDQIRSHIAMTAELSDRRLCRVAGEPAGDGAFDVTIAAYDFTGELAILCGLLAAEGLDVVTGSAFTTADPPEAGKPAKAGPAWWRKRTAAAPAANPLPKRTIIDTFRVRPLDPARPAPDWAALEGRLDGLLRLIAADDWRAAREALVDPVCETLRRFAPSAAGPALLPVRIDLDNRASADETVIRIGSADTPAFLFQLLTAFAMRGIYVRRMDIDTRNGQVVDELAVTDAKFRKLDVAAQGKELRAAVALIKQFSRLLPLSPNPPMALRNFGHFLDDLLARPDWPAELAELDRPASLTALARLMGVSEFLWEDFLRLQWQNLLPLLTRTERLAPRRSLAEMKADLAAKLAGKNSLAEKADVLNAWKDEEMFRIDMRHILGRSAGFTGFSAEMSDLAEAAVSTLFDLVAEDLAARHGRPRLPDGRPCRLCLAALGKTGGAEMGCASDVELMFLYEGAGTTDGPAPVGNAEFAGSLVTGLTANLKARREGIFEVDLRLRPHGDSGPLAVSAEAFEAYYGAGGPAPNLQRQALVRLRPIAGDPEFRAEVVRLRDRVLYEGAPLDIANLLHLRRRQADELVPPGRINAKFSAGAVVDIEYAVQALQVKYGRHAPPLRSPGTMAALHALESAGKLSPAEGAALREGYLFLRRLIDALRIVRGHAKDLCLPPRDSEEFAWLARRMGYPPARTEAAHGLADDTARTMEKVRRLSAAIYQREFPEAVAAAAAASS